MNKSSSSNSSAIAASTTTDASISDSSQEQHATTSCELDKSDITAEERSSLEVTVRQAVADTNDAAVNIDASFLTNNQPQDTASSVEEGPRQPYLQSYPGTVFGNQKRSYIWCYEYDCLAGCIHSQVCSV